MSDIKMGKIVKVIIVREGDDENDPLSDNPPQVMTRQEFMYDLEGVYTAHMDRTKPDNFAELYHQRYEEDW